jgi:hypothetical protein
MFRYLFVLCFAVLLSNLMIGLPRAFMLVGHKALLESHCYNSHDADKHKVRVRFDDLYHTITAAHRIEHSQAVQDALNAEGMPPDRKSDCSNYLYSFTFKRLVGRLIPIVC